MISNVFELHDPSFPVNFTIILSKFNTIKVIIIFNFKSIPIMMSIIKALTSLNGQQLPRVWLWIRIIRVKLSSSTIWIIKLIIPIKVPPRVVGMSITIPIILITMIIITPMMGVRITIFITPCPLTIITIGSQVHRSWVIVILIQNIMMRIGTWIGIVRLTRRWP